MQIVSENVTNSREPQMQNMSQTGNSEKTGQKEHHLEMTDQ